MYMYSIDQIYILLLLTLGTVVLAGLGPTVFDPLGLPLDFFELLFDAEGGDSNSELSSS